MTAEAPTIAERMRVTGIVQGVGFRPFIWRLARRLGLLGTVRNEGDRVVIEATGTQAALDALADAISRNAPPLARVERVERRPIPPLSASTFDIAPSEPGQIAAGISPDIATCPACLDEVTDPETRRFRHPFANCTDCGPRFSIVLGLPYDRARTGMGGFPLCPACRAEYEDPADRRFHAQPIACRACGPTLRLEAPGEVLDGDNALDRTASLLADGRIVAIKGIGGYHLACDAAREDVVALLRARKHRPAKPFALMMRDMAMVAAHCRVSEAERDALIHPSAPIVLLDISGRAALAPSLAPGQNRLGVMLPATPLHHLLMAAIDRPLVMSSANRAGCPQIFEDAEARALLGEVADALLSHDRPIARRLDDSVLFVADGACRVMRRARGLAPAPIALPPGFADAPPVLALGADLKSAICLTHGGKALLSHHLGDLDRPANLAAFEAAIDDYSRLFAHRPAAIVVDRHPDYRCTRHGAALARRLDVPLLHVQHHHAHIAAAMAEHRWPMAAGPLIGIALDGIGAGEDGTIWGGEILLCDYRESRRIGRLRPMPMPGGDVASREPWRMLLAHLDICLGPDESSRRLTAAGRADLFAGRPVAPLRAMMASGMGAPLASSAGRLFDAVAALLGHAPDRLSHEGEAAMALEAAAGDHDAAPLPFAVERQDGLTTLCPAPMWGAMLDGLARGMGTGMLAAAFHRGLAASFADAAIAAAARNHIGTVALSGGVMQNRLLLEALAGRLRAAGLNLLVPASAPANDGGIALGQAAIAAARLMH